MKYLLIALVKAYRKLISPLKPRCCRFIPSCSEYSIEALRTRGAIVGTALTVSRILRCNPFCKGGYDPVPLKGEARGVKCNPDKDILFLSDKAHDRK